ncbi:peptidoglycan-binding protein [Natronosporangium hydrolyticum]|uniref:Peptidoglycan-binding protein n=1 Tax=Natronosporangium hydrolyticum TaxID=2811111 RepID=A0A895YDQ1_9ACTN|nr:peptidoglycan-binding domain-containing protein [Natronosporangium hydrolyticum]QSB14302.1 peptidoglycan-binding protein [Natronosporangium hydrolyticum]
MAQLQRLLASQGFWSESADGSFDYRLYWAVRAWQRNLGVVDDGRVRAGDVVFVPRLPAKLALDEEVQVGTVLTGVEPLIHVLPEKPTFTIQLPEGQARLVQLGMAVTIHHESGSEWQAEIIDIRVTDEGQRSASLAGLAGRPVCGDECDVLPLSEETLLPSTIEVIAPVQGVAVPASAVVTTATGETVVVMESGDLQQVTVVAAAAGMAVVEGIELGDLVRAPGTDPAQLEVAP